MHLNLIDEYAKALDELDARIEEAMAPLRAAGELLCSIPGFSTTVAEVFLAETGADMTVFPTAGHFASWPGTAPGSNESAGRVKSTKTRPGNRHLKGALGIAALAASRSKRTYFSAKYKRIASHRGPMKALVAVEHAMLVAAWNMLTNGEFYRDPGPACHCSSSRSFPRTAETLLPTDGQAVCRSEPNRQVVQLGRGLAAARKAEGGGSSSRRSSLHLSAHPATDRSIRYWASAR